MATNKIRNVGSISSSPAPVHAPTNGAGWSRRPRHGQADRVIAPNSNGIFLSSQSRKNITPIRARA